MFICHAFPDRSPTLDSLHSHLESGLAAALEIETVKRGAKVGLSQTPRTVQRLVHGESSVL